MSPDPRPSPEEESRQRKGGNVMLRVGLALIDDARRGEGFETDEAKLATRVEEILDELGAASPRPGAPAVTGTPHSPDRVLLYAPTGESTSESALLRSDGVLLEEFSSFGIAEQEDVEADMEKLPPERQGEIRQAQEWLERRERVPPFRGERFLRALAADPQSGSDLQILAIELFADGLIVHYTADLAPQSPDSTGSRDWLGGTAPWARFRVEDDLGTEYSASESNNGGVQVVHGAHAFAPAVPAAARVLRVATDSGTVELALQPTPPG